MKKLVFGLVVYCWIAGLVSEGASGMYIDLAVTGEKVSDVNNMRIKDPNALTCSDSDFVKADPYRLYFGEYSDEFTSYALSKAAVLFYSICGFDDSSADKFMTFLQKTSNSLPSLSESERVAFFIMLVQISNDVPGEAAFPYGDEAVISFAHEVYCRMQEGGKE